MIVRKQHFFTPIEESDNFRFSSQPPTRVQDGLSILIQVVEYVTLYFILVCEFALMSYTPSILIFPKSIGKCDYTPSMYAYVYAVVIRCID